MNQHQFWNSKDITQLLLEMSKKAVAMQSELTIFEKIIRNFYEVYTDVDVAIEKDITKYFLERDPSYKIIGEETIHEILLKHDPLTLFEESAIVIDPIDGTQNFISRLPNWAISIGQIISNEFINGAIALPILGEIYISENNKVGAFHSKIQLSELSVDNNKLNGTEKKSIVLKPFTIPTITNLKHITYSSAKILFDHLKKTSYKFQINRSCVYGIAKVISGSYFAYIGKANIWDYAACIGLFRALGKSVYYFDKDNNTLETLPWKISEEHWIHNTYTRYPLIFAQNYELALKTIPKI